MEKDIQMTPGPFHLFDSELAPRMVIEASAGTGKTWNITGFYLRLILEKRVLPDRILVMTFTRMATRELKERILGRLRESLRAVECGQDGGDPFLADLLKFCKDRPWAAAHLREAIRNFDEAAVSTIHGFCRQILQEESLIAGLPPDPELVQMDELLLEAASDFWRLWVERAGETEAGRLWLSMILDQAKTPEDLLDLLKPVLERPDAHLEGVEPCDPHALFQKILELRFRMVELWEKELAQIQDELLESDVRGMTSRFVGSRIRAMSRFLSGSPHDELGFDRMKFFLPSWFPENLRKGGSRLPRHPFFDLCEEYEKARAEVPRAITRFYSDAACEIRKLRQQKSALSPTLTYDDLLERLDTALADPRTGEELACRIRKRFPYALVDEFQDTDPVQYRILDRIYPAGDAGTLLMMIGDPKQSIYAFRGADLYSYILARQSVPGQHCYSLEHNYRSRPSLVEAVNELFGRHESSPFLEEQIRYRPVRSGVPEVEKGFLVDGVPPVPMRIFSALSLSEAAPWSKRELRPRLFRETARQIVELILKGRQGRALLADENVDGGMRPLHGGDIAVLLNSHRDIESIRKELRRYGISSVVYSRERIFRTREAVRLTHLLEAILEPASSRKLQTALATGFFGLRLSTLVDHREKEEEHLGLMLKMQKLQEIWYRSGSFPMLRKILFEEKALVRLARLDESERILVNLQQLMELMAAAEQEKGLDPPSLLRWLKRKMADSSDDDEETLRLESDENLVRILTVHSSKGLEFPVVFCPALWEGIDPKRRRRIAEIWHEKKEPFNAVINLEQQESETRKSARERALLETVAEEVRKCYVALTRAKYECRIFWGVSEVSHWSGMGPLLLEPDMVKRSIYENFQIKEGGEIAAGALTGSLGMLAAERPDLFSFTYLDGKDEPVAPLPPEAEDRKLVLREYRGPDVLSPRHTLYSFSSIILQKESYSGSPEPTLIAEADLVPDRGRFTDDEPFQDDDSDSDPEFYPGSEAFLLYRDQKSESHAEDQEGGPADLFHFPRGKSAGTFIHRIFELESLDFRAPLQSREAIRDLMERWGIEERWLSALVKMVEDVAGAEYGKLKLSETPPEEMIREMEFTFKVSEPRLELLRAFLDGGLSSVNGAARPGRVRADYLTGFIDLIVRHRGLWYIIDYKSNHLGDTREEYNRQALQKEIVRADYDLQYHLYVVALKKYLEAVSPGFDYSTSFGGVYYLFLRGMQKGSADGIWYDRPDPERVMELERILDRNEERYG